MSLPAKKLPLVISASPLDGDAVNRTIDEAQSHDMVFALVGHAGAGASTVGKKLKSSLEMHGYEVSFVKMSELIADCIARLNNKLSPDRASTSRIERTRALQDAGNWLRKNKGQAFTAGLAVRKVREIRIGAGREGQKLVFIIDNLKNPTEVDALRKVYGRAFYLISVVCGPARRRERLTQKYEGAPPGAIPSLMERDEAESDPAGQQVRKTIKSGDYFVNNEDNLSKTKASQLEDSIKRFTQIVLGVELETPTKDERGMYAAWTASLRSSCLSRQVGAALLDGSGQLIATGVNDVPRFGGGLYEEGDVEDHRCFTSLDVVTQKGYCRNDREKQEILKQIGGSLAKGGMLRDGVDETAIAAALRATRVGDLIEFSRAVHAELDAIVSVARGGTGTTQGATLYCTTYPCHICARHIVAAGIRDVIYIEPYTKSLAMELHSDAVLEATEAARDDSAKVHFRLFNGVAPRRYAALFERRGEAKDGQGVAISVADALHKDPIFTRSHIDFETVIADRVAQEVGGDGS